MNANFIAHEKFHLFIDVLASFSSIKVSIYVPERKCVLLEGVKMYKLDERGFFTALSVSDASFSFQGL